MSPKIRLGVLASVTALFAGLYFFKPRIETHEIIREVPHDVIREITKEIPIEKFIEKRIEVPVEVIKEVPAKIPQEYLDALAVKNLLYSAKPATYEDCLAGVTDVQVFINHSATMPEGKIALSDDALRTRMELRLRTLGIPVKDDSRWIVRADMSMIPSNTVGGTKLGWAYDVQIGLVDRYCYIGRPAGWLLGWGEIYQTSGVVGIGPLNSIESDVLSVLDGQLDEFANKWLKHNGKWTSQRHAGSSNLHRSG